MTKVKAELDKLPKESLQPGVPNLQPKYGSPPSEELLNISTWEVRCWGRG
jgi:hypothetical protein